MRVPISVAMICLALAPLLLANDGAAIPVRVVTVFKDGHAFLLHEGEMATDEQGDVLLDPE